MNNKIILLTFIVTISSKIEGYGKLRIVGGYNADISAFPYVVSLHSNDETSICAGTIIGKREILTAAHCVENIYASYFVRVGSNYADRGGQNYKVQTVVAHPNYHSNSGSVAPDFDIAVLILRHSISFNDRVSAVTLPGQNDNILDNSRFQISGFGNERLKSTELQFVNFHNCANRYSSMNFRVTGNMICAANNPHEECYGDSGGPVVLHGRLAGIISGGKGCSNSRYPGIYTRVAGFITWIQGSIRQAAYGK